jgi:hypothetical protein
MDAPMFNITSEGAGDSAILVAEAICRIMKESFASHMSENVTMAAINTLHNVGNHTVSLNNCSFTNKDIT